VKLEDIPVYAQNVFVVHELLRRCGFPNDDLHVIVDMVGQVLVQVHSQGKEFNVGVALLSGTPAIAASEEVVAAARPKLLAGIKALNKAPDAFLHEVFKAFFARHPPDYRAGLVVALIEAGFEMRPNPAREAWA
jgi:hypothetical protein